MLQKRDGYRAAASPARRYFTRLDQVTQLSARAKRTPRFDRRLIAKLLKAPALVVPLDEVGDGGTHVVEMLERLDRRSLAP